MEEAMKNVRLRINFLSAQKPGLSPNVAGALSLLILKQSFEVRPSSLKNRSAF
jgi:hypothetical protein